MSACSDHLLSLYLFSKRRSTSFLIYFLHAAKWSRLLPNQIGLCLTCNGNKAFYLIYISCSGAAFLFSNSHLWDGIFLSVPGMLSLSALHSYLSASEWVQMCSHTFAVVWNLALESLVMLQSIATKKRSCFWMHFLQLHLLCHLIRHAFAFPLSSLFTP